MQNKADYYYIPTKIDKIIANYIIGLLDEEFLEDGGITTSIQNNNLVNKKIRDCKIGWISYTHWISGVMVNCIIEANQKFFKYDLTGWANNIQYTVYDQKDSKYNWHCDTGTANLLNKCETRKLSISLLLSDPNEYEGGEFQLQLCGRKDMITIKPPLGYAIIFPSTSVHRVRPIKSGRRISLVGWYGGPNFR